MGKRIYFLFSLFFSVLIFSWVAAGWGGVQQGPPPKNPQVEKPGEAAETIVPGPKDIKQRTALYVFIGWLWLSIGVCIFVLRQKIKEADRLLSLGIFSNDNQRSSKS